MLRKSEKQKAIRPGAIKKGIWMESALGLVVIRGRSFKKACQAPCWALVFRGDRGGPCLPLAGPAGELLLTAGLGEVGVSTSAVPAARPTLPWHPGPHPRHSVGASRQTGGLVSTPAGKVATTKS